VSSSARREPTVPRRGENLGPYSRAIEARTCFHHIDRPTGRSCTRCGRPACPDCLHEAPVGAHCWECIKAARPPAGERLRRWNARSSLLVTKVIIGLNLAVFVLTTFEGGGALGRVGRLQARLALYGPAIAGGEWYRLLTSGFVHYGLVHIAFNMVILYRFGEMLEPALGRARLVALYVAALLAGSFGAVLLQPTGRAAGASGAVFGLVGAAAVGLRRRGIDVWRSGVGPLLAINLVLTFVIPGISIGGHLGGLAGGVAVGGVMLQSPPSRPALARDIAFAALVAALAVAGALWAAHR
jgi:membrane associated rhomboid family serine protease